MTDPQTVNYAQVDISLYGQIQDETHLRVLVICQYVWGGLLAVMSLIPVIHLVLGIMMLSGVLNGGPNPPPREMGWFFVGFASVFILLGELMALLNIYAAWSMSRRRRRVFSLVVAGINCISVPFGTLLGVFTFLVLLRESVRRLYEESDIALAHHA